MSDFNAAESILEQVLGHRRRENEALEMMCEQMLTDPRGWGILVIRDQVISFDEPFKMQIEYGLNEFIPFGHIYEFPSRDAFATWVAKGAPRS